MPKPRTFENIERVGKCIYLDAVDWKFYEGGSSIKTIESSATLEIFTMPEDKLLTCVLTIEDEHGGIKLRLSPYDFKELNEMFKRASFKVK